MTIATQVDKTTNSPRTRQRRPEEVRARILTAALDAFATHGFAGTSTREVAKEAHVTQSLLLYHYKSKERLWQSVMEDVHKRLAFSKMDDGGAAPQTASERLRRLIRNLVETFAEVPALHRLMTLEAHQPSDRLIWMCDRFLKDDFHEFCGLILDGQREGKVQLLDPSRMRFAILAMAAVPFAVSAEYQYLTKKNPFSSAEIENAVDFINKLVFV